MSKTVMNGGSISIPSGGSKNEEIYEQLCAILVPDATHAVSSLMQACLIVEFTVDIDYS